MHIYAREYAMIDVHEIMLPYAGIIRIRFMGMISATVTRAPLQTLFRAKIVFFHLKELPIIKNYTTGYGTEVSTRLETGLPERPFS